LTVEDDGPAFRREQRTQVGERGERLDESVPGSGLGLAIVRDISKLYGGFFSLKIVPWGASRPVWSCPLFNKRNRTLTISA
jgi:signal transduction histidine kinase